MRRKGIVITALTWGFGLGACSLFVDLDGLSNGDTARDACAAGCGDAGETGDTGARGDAAEDTGSRDSATPDAVAESSIEFVNVTSADLGATLLGIVQLDSGAEPGNTLIVAVADSPSDGGEDLSIADDQGNTYTNYVTIFNDARGVKNWVSGSIRIGGGVVQQLTVSLADRSTPPTSFEVYVHEYKGVTAFDVGNANEGTSTAVDGMMSGVATTTGSRELVFGYGDTGRATAGTGFTTRSAFHSNVTEDRFVVLPGPQQTTATMTAGSDWEMLMATFKGN